MRLTGPQISAAIALSKMTQDQLATAAKIGRNTLNRAINNTAETKDETLQTIRRTLEAHGIEFINNQGVQYKTTDVTIYDGLEAFEDFHDFLYFHLKQYGGDVCLSIYDEPLLAKYRKNPEIHRSRMRELVGGGTVTFRILTTKSSWNTHGYIDYRYLPDQSASPTGFYAFGDCLALVSFVNPHSPYIVMLQSGPLTEAYRQGFNIAWETAQKPPILVNNP